MCLKAISQCELLQQSLGSWRLPGSQVHPGAPWLWHHMCRPQYNSMLCHKDSTRWGCHYCKGSILSTRPRKNYSADMYPADTKELFWNVVWKCFSYLVYFALNYPFIHQTVVPGCCTMAKQLLLIKSYGLSFQPSQHAGLPSSLTALEMIISWCLY